MIRKKRQGERFKGIFDELDYQVIIELSKKSLGVLALTKILNVEHKTAKKHIDRLESYGFIVIKHRPQNKKLLVINEKAVKLLELLKNKEDEE